MSTVGQFIKLSLISAFFLLSGHSQAAAPESGWWWNPAEGGRGFTIEVQNGIMFMAGYMYDDAGRATWYASGPTKMVSDSLYQGVWTQYGNGQTLSGGYKGATVVNANYGSITISFSTPTTGTLTLPSGVMVPLSRFKFGGSDTGGTVTATCTFSNFTIAKYDAIAVGMTPNQVSQTMGCANNPAFTQRGTNYLVYVWVDTNGSGARILVYFDQNGLLVMPLAGSTTFKGAAGF